MCRLQLLDLRGNPRLFKQEYCNCQLLLAWIKRRQGDNFKLFPEPDFICKNSTEGKILNVDPEMCNGNETQMLLEESDLVAKSCETEVMKYGSGPLRLKGSVTWMLVAAGVSAFILLLFFGLYCIRKRHEMKESESEISNVREKCWRT